MSLNYQNSKGQERIHFYKNWINKFPSIGSSLYLVIFLRYLANNLLLMLSVIK